MRTSYARFNASWMKKKNPDLPHNIECPQPLNGIDIRSRRAPASSYMYQMLWLAHRLLNYRQHPQCIYIYMVLRRPKERYLNLAIPSANQRIPLTFVQSDGVVCCLLRLRVALLFDLGAWLHMYFFFISSEATHKSVKKCEHIWWRRGFCLKQVSRAAIYTICIALKRLRCVGPKHMYFLI